YDTQFPLFFFLQKINTSILFLCISLLHGTKRRAESAAAFLTFHTFSAQTEKLQFMIQYMESRRFFDVILKLIQKIRIERDHFAAFPAYEMVMIVFCLIQQQMTDLIAHTPVIKVDPVYELHIPE